MVRPGSNHVVALRASLTGSIIDRDDPAFDDARRVWNAAIDRRPMLIVRCASPDDVAAAIGFAREQGLEIAVRGGTHSVAGSSTLDGALVIDLGELNQVTVDPRAKRALAGGGALVRDVHAATQAHGLAVPTGLVSRTGIGGLTLGGGMGWLTRFGGLTIDNVVSAQIVTADGRILRADENEHPDLFWAVRGGGGNFGVVTKFEFRLHEIGPAVHFGFLFWGPENGAEALRLARDVIPTLPREINVLIAGLNAPPGPFVPPEHQFQPGYALLVAGFGSAEGHAQAVSRLRAVPPQFEFVDTMPYVALQRILDEEDDEWGSLRSYADSVYVEDLSRDAIEVITQHLPRRGSPFSSLLLYRLDGAYSEVAEDDTAFGGGRSPRYAVYIVAVCASRKLLAADRLWVQSFRDALRPYAIGPGGYVNIMSECDVDRVRASYGPAKYKRLARIKSEYDAGNLFHGDADLQPRPGPVAPDVVPGRSR